MIHLSQLVYGPRGLGPIDLALQTGQLVMLCGPSGSGKSTLGQLLLGDLEATSGQVVWQSEGSVRCLSHDAEAQLLGSTIAQELEFGAGSEVGPTPLARSRELLLKRFRGRESEDPQALSLNEQQLLLLGSLVSSDIQLLILDEALSCLDDASFSDVCRFLRLMTEDGLAVLVISHELRMVPWCDRCLGLLDGRVAFDCRLDDLTWGHLHSARVWLGSLSGQVAEERVLVSPSVRVPGGFTSGGGEELAMPSLFRWREQEFCLGADRALAVAGVSGSGKSRLLATVLGGPQLSEWSSLVGDSCYRAMLPQRAQSILWGRTVAGELAASSGEGRRRNPHMLGRLEPECGLPRSWLARSPRSLSHGQAKYVAALCLLLQAPDLLLLDEAFAGLDSDLRAELLARLAIYREAGGQVVMATHHPDEMVLYAGRLLVLDEGMPAWFGRGWDYFRQHPETALGQPSLLEWGARSHSARDARDDGQP